MRHLEGKTALAVNCIAIAMAVFHIYTAAFGSMVALLQRSVHLTFAFALIFLLTPACKTARNNSSSLENNLPQKDSLPLIDVILALLAAVSFFYVSVNYEVIRERMSMVDELTWLDLFCGGTAILLCMEAARRALGLAMAIIPALAILYALLGDNMPGFLWHRGFTLPQIIDYLYMGYDGIFGIPVGISATYLVIFIIFGSIMEMSGTGQLIMDLACTLAGRSRGGPAKVAVIASALFGSVSGSAVSNVYATGTFSIPLMKRLGYKPEFAGAVEAVSSTGGQLVPPVLGAAAFIMAEWLGVSYGEVCVAAIIPAFLYFLAVILMVHLEAVKTGLRGIEENQIPDKSKVIKNLYLLLPLVVLMALLYTGYSVSRSATIAMGTAFAVSWLRRTTRMDLFKTLKALEIGAKRASTIAIATACAGVIIGVITLTGIGLSLTGLIVTSFQDNLFMALLFTMAASLVMGMGVPTVVAYIIVATLTAPILTRLGVPPLAAHMFVFYFGIISMITPPVAVAAWAGAEIAGSDYNRTGFVAVRLGVVAFVVPFMFIYGPALLCVGPLPQILLALISATLGVYCVACALAGWMFIPTPLWQQALLVTAGLSLIFPGFYTDLLGAVLFLVVFLVQRLSLRNTTKAD